VAAAPAALEHEAVEYLRRLVRVDTTNPPGNERPAAEYVAEVGRAAGLESVVIDSAPGRGNAVLRLRGTGAARPLLLLSHLDVVPAEPAKWRQPPFEGVLADGCVWGRGSVDSKLTTAVGLTALLEIARSGVRPRRDIILAATASEETGGPANGAGYLAKHHPDLIAAEYVINEGGGWTIELGGRIYYTVQTAEKGGCTVDLVAKGTPGHASVPHDDNPIPKLGRALDRLQARKMPAHITETLRRFLEGVADDHAAAGSSGMATAIRALLDPRQADDALRRLPVDPSTRLLLDAMLRNTAAPTVLMAGTKRNVIPSEARAQLSGRPLPGQTRESFLAELRAVVGGEVDLDVEGFAPGLEAELDPAFEAAALGALRRHDPDARMLPVLMTGGTDAKRIVDLGAKVYGFVPMPHEPGADYMSLCHGHDERVSTRAIGFGVAVTLDLLQELAL
jgi:acetylornithine deacetylase/succinyl-diaminopimelate desuccinylase-like protein